MTTEDPIDDLLDVLDLTREGSTTINLASPEAEGEDLGSSQGDVFVGRSQPQPHGRAFGGQVLAQSVIAAGLTVADVTEAAGDPPRHIHSMHGYFLRPGDAQRPIRFLVERMRDGRSFSARRIHAVQDGRILLSMITSFQDEDDGLNHQSEMPQVPGPDGLPSDAAILGGIDHPQARHLARRAVEIKHVEGPLFLEAGEQTAQQHVWFRVPRELPDDPLLHAAVLAYASDFSLLEPILRKHGLVWGDPRLRPASLDHAMWFHRTPRADDWILYRQASPSAQNGRGLGHGLMFAQDGTLMASVAQEGMVRLKG
ncbi:MAG: acyl-CoA thioesterase II [Ornithinimicrobium sp.]